jgi:neurofibromin 1
VDDILREKVWNFSRAVTIDTLTTSQGFTISYQALVIDYILSTIRLDHVRFFQTSLPSLVQEDTPSVFKLAFISACLTIVQEENTMPWNPTIDTLYSSISSALRRIFIQTVKIELSTPTSRSDISSATSGSRKLGGDKTLINRLQNTASVLQSILRLFRLDPMTALKVKFLSKKKKKKEELDYI